MNALVVFFLLSVGFGFLVGFLFGRAEGRDAERVRQEERRRKALEIYARGYKYMQWLGS